MTLELGQRLVTELWGLDARLEPLTGWADRNFLARTSGGDRFVLKISAPDARPEPLESQVAALQHLAGSSVATVVPRVVPSASGTVLVPIEDRAGRPRWARLLSHLPGRQLALIGERPATLLESIGRTLARLDLALADFAHPGLRTSHEWDLMATTELAGFAGGIRQPARRVLIEARLARFANLVEPRRAELEHGVIHGDANDHNLLVRGGQGGPRLVGIIDFGDLLRSAVVAELAIAVAYIMLDRDDPFADAAHLVRGYDSERRLSALERELLPELVLGRLCASALHSAEGRRRDPGNDYLQISAAPVWRLLETLTGDGERRLAELFDTSKPGGRPPGRSVDEILAIRRRHLGRNLSVSYAEPLKIVRGAGQFLYDADGRRYLDLVNNVCHVGHCHPRVVAAGQRQMAELNTNTRYLHDHLAEYALRLTATFPAPLGVCFFVCSGTEANDLALRLARTRTGTREIVVVEHAYHGHSPSLIEISTYKCRGPGGEGLAPHAHAVPMPDTYRGPHRGSDAGARYADEVRRVVDGLVAAGRPPGAFMAESFIGCGGQVIPPDGFMAAAFETVRSAGGVCVADEVQVGFGRAGSHFWAFETLGVVPDIVTLGKPMGNGHPIAAVVTTPEIADSFATGMEYFNTFGGNPVSCAVGLAVLEVIESECLQARAAELGDRFLDGLRQLQGRHRLVGDVRGRGLFLGVELVRDHETLEAADGEAAEVVNAMRRRGFLLSTDGPLHNVLKLKPPMVLTAADVDSVLDALDEVLNGLEARS